MSDEKRSDLIKILLYAALLWMSITILKHEADTGWGAYPSTDLLDLLRP
jgi:hypothetical protein